MGLRLETGMRDLFVRPDGRSLAARARRRRWEMLRHRFEGLSEMAVVDLGGTPSFWREAPAPPRHVTCVNPGEVGEAEEDEPWLTVVRRDACTVEDLGTFDLVFSNSTIEHVGGHARRVEFARRVRSLAPSYWVQTPNRYFFLEPHLLFPGAQFLPTRERAYVATRWPLSNVRRRSGPAAVESVLEIDLLTRTEMRHYFPGADLLEERFLGLTKSIIAVHRAG